MVGAAVRAPQSISVAFLVFVALYARTSPARADEDGGSDAGDDAAATVTIDAGEGTASAADGGIDAEVCPQPNDEVGPCLEADVSEECVTSTGLGGACVVSPCLGKLVCRPGIASGGGCCDGAAASATPATVSPFRFPRRATFAALASLAFFAWHRRRRSG